MRFSHNYVKTPINTEDTRILEVFIVFNKDELSKVFLEYDTKTISGINYKLPSGKLMIILLISKNILWTTIRSWNPEKEKYYKSLRGKEIPIQVITDNYINK